MRHIQSHTRIDYYWTLIIVLVLQFVPFPGTKSLNGSDVSDNVHVRLPETRDAGYHRVCVLVEDVKSLDGLLSKNNICRQVVQHVKLQHLCDTFRDKTLAVVELSDRESSMNDARGVSNAAICKLKCFLGRENVESSRPSKVRANKVQIRAGVGAGKSCVRSEAANQVLLGFPNAVHPQGLHTRCQLLDHAIRMLCQCFRLLQELHPHDDGHSQGTEDVEDTLWERPFGR